MDKSPLDANKGPIPTPVCMFVNVQLVGVKPGCGIQGNTATVLLENPKGEFVLDQSQLLNQVYK